jgi:dihydroorotase/N-acyl-D-amino-acid deacylase
MSLKSPSVLLLLGWAMLTAGPAFSGERSLDVILEGGTVFSGDGSPGVVTDVGISGDRIAAVGMLADRPADLRLDVSGLAVTPGFIDIHSHAQRRTVEKSGILTWPDAENYIRQGVTTAIGGPDGSSWYPLSEFFDKLEAAPAAVNFGTFVGHNTIRGLAMGRAEQAPTAAELDAMKAMVKSAMEQGAFGLSSGLKYIPGAYADTGEVIELARVAGAHGGIYITHMREEGLGLLDSVSETIRIGEEAGLPAQITHHKAMGAKMWGRSRDSLALVDEANRRGADISIDQYPYAASSTNTDVLFPAWSLADGREAQLARLADPATRVRIRQGIIANIRDDRGGNDPARVAIASCDWDPSLNGLNLAEILSARGEPVTIENAADLVMELQEKGGCMGVFHAMAEQDVVRIMQHPRTMVASDGGIHMPAADRPHPRNYGSFARVLGRYVREQGVLSFEEALLKMTRMPADRIGLSERGRIEAGAAADIAVLDPKRVIDRATFADPHQFSEGVEHVFVNGQAVLLDGRMTGARPGRVLRNQP